MSYFSISSFAVRPLVGVNTWSLVGWMRPVVKIIAILPESKSWPRWKAAQVPYLPERETLGRASLEKCGSVWISVDQCGSVWQGCSRTDLLTQRKKRTLKHSWNTTEEVQTWLSICSMSTPKKKVRLTLIRPKHHLWSLFKKSTETVAFQSDRPAYRHNRIRQCILSRWAVNETCQHCDMRNSPINTVTHQYCKPST